MDTDAAVSWGLKMFPEGTGSECVTGSVTNNVVVPIAPMNAAAVVGALNDTTNPATQPQGNGTPTGDAITAAFNYLKTLTSTNPKYILLATDGAPSCAGTTKDSSTARTYAYTHVMDAASASPPIYTFVVGVATNSSSETSTLNMLADAGGRPRPGLLTHFYLGNTTSELTAALAPDHRTGGDLHVPAEPAAAGPERADEAGHVLSADRQPEDVRGDDGLPRRAVVRQQPVHVEGPVRRGDGERLGVHGRQRHRGAGLRIVVRHDQGVGRQHRAGHLRLPDDRRSVGTAWGRPSPARRPFSDIG